MDAEKKPFEAWALVEVMGHQKFAGRVSEEHIGGATFVRVDVPESDGIPAFTKLLGAGSIFSITPTTEEVARGVAQRWQARPLSLYDLPAMQSPAMIGNYDDETHHDDGDDEPSDDDF